MGCGCGKSSKQAAIKAAQEQKKVEEARRALAEPTEPEPELESVGAASPSK